jgi:DNA polymerase sigma
VLLLLALVAAGLCRPYGANGGYDAEGKREVVTHLRKVQKESYRSMDVMTVKLIGNARIPVLKLQLRSGLELDASINDTSGVNAASFLQSWVCC